MPEKPPGEGPEQPTEMEGKKVELTREQLKYMLDAALEQIKQHGSADPEVIASAAWGVRSGDFMKVGDALSQAISAERKNVERLTAQLNGSRYYMEKWEKLFDDLIRTNKASRRENF